MNAEINRKSLGAFYGNVQQKTRIINQLTMMSEHGKYNQFIYWNEGTGTGCAVGGVLSSQYDKRGAFNNPYEMFGQMTNIPAYIPDIMEEIFILLEEPVDHSTFPADFMRSIPVGFSDWDRACKVICEGMVDAIIHVAITGQGDKSIILKYRGSDRLYGMVCGNLDLTGVEIGMSSRQIVEKLVKTNGSPKKLCKSLMGYFQFMSTDRLQKVNYDNLAKSVTKAMLEKLAPVQKEPLVCRL